MYIQDVCILSCIKALSRVKMGGIGGRRLKIFKRIRRDMEKESESGRKVIRWMTVLPLPGIIRWCM